MWWELDEEIGRVSRARIRDFERYMKRVHDENVRRRRRSVGSPTVERVRRPPLWSVDPGFDPYHVRANRRRIAHAIESALRAGTYTPRPPAAVRVPKRDGGWRVVSAFPIADEVVSGRLYRSLLQKNRARLSSRAYAYRDDVNLYDAIAHLKDEFYGRQRLFIAEYDFSDYFGNISHDHLWRTIDDLGFVLTTLERRVLEAFLTAPLPTPGGAGPAVARTRGVPQGTSTSLLLANIAATPLDRSLEGLDIGFARYADDTLIWSRDYASICRAAEALHEAAGHIGAPVNLAKSKGIRLLLAPGATRGEIPFTTEVEFLSHRVRPDCTSIGTDSIEGIRGRINKILFDNLLREPLAGTQDFGRIGFLDRDYAAYIWELRRLLYGHLSEAQVRSRINGPVPPQVLRGALSSFPLVDDQTMLRDLDAWILTQTWLTLRKRAAVLRASVPISVVPDPWDLPRDRLVGLRGTSARTGRSIDLRLPSAVRMSAVIRRAVEAHGTGIVGWRTSASLYGGR